MSVPNRLVKLGTVLDLRVERDGEIRRISWRGEHWLCADASKKRLFIVPALKKKAGTLGKRFSELQGVYREWHQFDAEHANSGTVKLGEPVVRGRVRTIGYRSDKWSGRARDYEHDFDEPPRLTQIGDVYRIAGKSVRVTPRGITG